MSCTQRPAMNCQEEVIEPQNGDLGAPQYEWNKMFRDLSAAENKHGAERIWFETQPRVHFAHTGIILGIRRPSREAAEMLQHNSSKSGRLFREIEIKAPFLQEGIRKDAFGNSLGRTPTPYPGLKKEEPLTLQSRYVPTTLRRFCVDCGLRHPDEDDCPDILHLEAASSDDDNQADHWQEVGLHEEGSTTDSTQSRETDDEAAASFRALTEYPGNESSVASDSDGSQAGDQVSENISGVSGEEAAEDDSDEQEIINEHEENNNVALLFANNAIALATVIAIFLIRYFHRQYR